MPETFEQDYPLQQLQQVTKSLNSGQFVQVRRMLAKTAPCDTALLLESSPHKVRRLLWQLVDPDVQGDVLEELSEDVRLGIIAQMEPKHIAAATEDMGHDDLGEVLRSLPDTVYKDVVSAMDIQDRERATQALSYQERSAGALMNTDTVTIRPDVTLDVVLRYIRLRGELPEGTDDLYVVDKHNCFLGALSLSTLLTNSPEKIVHDLMDEDCESIPISMDESEVAQLFERHNWISAPVVDDNAQLLGRVTIDDIVDVIREDAEHHLLGLAGLDDEEDTFAPVLKSSKKRSVWLGVNLLTALAAAFVASFFEGTLAILPILAVLNGIVPSMGGVAGSQSLTLVIRGIAVGHINQTNQRFVMIKELAIGALNGILWAVLIASVIALWQWDLMLGAVLAFAMFMNLVVAGVAGACIPIILKRMKIDPALAGSVILTTVTDIVGIFAFLGTATWLLV
ncbi:MULTISPECIES: magnesium transporter [Pseudoalteromonas]|jgi:magnesium transporter|uniref:Magnesium transporter MgtE n=3 Tax=Pseudoalteromonas TaxID=53246 RepID=Q3IG52_PSET1|nr:MULTISPECIES: magnesium transporter [Pseudoalteromonas]ALS34096.1 magnesium transporter [Pseudoalteromonas translucida KMM 520]ASM55174.1 magnesium transporter [Pseudoalteromonas nigrifaciens]MBB1369335.1 magnesium transporter [Pseudoalteromonas sp. SR45-4]MBB1405716.1 magnesium transporter [Pseudoalteromonas sp. SG44-5]MBE0419823.1 magnesium transporter [Pseudoalteromonas nigrifaciens]|tara:strand:+ start:27848 stop:29206 length:1359 start_codon:yes stop_codon:yes gene_type:complete